MADYEKEFLSRILFKNELRDVVDRRIDPKMLADAGNRKAFEFVLEFYQKYGEVPSIDLVEQEFPDLKLEYAKEPVGFYIDKLIEQYVRNRGSRILTDNARQFVLNPMDGLELLRSEFARLTIEANPTRDVNLVETMNERKKRYLELKSLDGIDGFPTPWNVLNEATMGWHPGEFISIVSRPAVGKTFLLLIFAEYAWSNGLSVLFINNEMSGEQIGRRFDAVHFQLPYKEFRAGLLPDILEEKYFKGLEKMEKDQSKNPMWVISDVTGVMSVASKIDQYKPDIVMIDGMYLLSDDRGGGSKWESISNVSRDLKKLAQQKDVPIIATTQFNRATDEARIERVTLSNIGFSDSLGQDCLPKDTIIWTDRGLVRLDELDDAKDRVFDGEEFRKFKLLKEKEKEVYEVHLKDSGQVFRCSGDHGLLVMSGRPELEWKKAQDLQPGDLVVKVEGSLDGGEIEEIEWEYEPATSALKTIRLPISRKMGFDEVEKVVPTGIVETMYDLSVETTHRFVAEGLVVHNSDVVLGLFRTRDMELNNEMFVRMLKVREGQPVDFSLLWDLHKMEFKVISTDDDNEFIDDDFDSIDF